MATVYLNTGEIAKGELKWHVSGSYQDLVLKQEGKKVAISASDVDSMTVGGRHFLPLIFDTEHAHIAVLMEVIAPKRGWYYTQFLDVACTCDGSKRLRKAYLSVENDRPCLLVKSLLFGRISKRNSHAEAFLKSKELGLTTWRQLEEFVAP